MLNLQLSTILNIQILRRNVLFQLSHIFKQVNLVLCAFGDEKRHNFPHCSVKEVSPKDVKVVEQLRVAVVEDRHELFHWVLWHLVRISHVSTVENHAYLVSFLLRHKITSLLCKFVPLFNHVQQIPQVLVSSRQPLDMVPHPDYQNRTADNVLTAKPVLARLVNLANDGLISRYPVRPVLLIPLNPLAPLLDGLLAIEFPCDWEAGDGVDVGVEGLSLLDGLVLLGEDLLDFGLVGFDLCEFAVSNSEWILAVHWIEMVNFINKRYTQISCGEINFKAWFLLIFS